MTAPILITKLYIPSTRAELVQRPELIERLKDGLDKKLTLISAPAGFGKTTLVSHWLENLREDKEIHSHSIQVAWLSLDEDDNDPVRFLTYFITAFNQIKEIDADIGQGALSMLQSPQPPPANTVLISLINDLATISEKVIFVLDDYHLIQAQIIHQALVFLLENLPPQLHLVIATRQDPPLFLSRLRAQDQITELRAADLRFTSIEAADFLNQVMGLNLSSGDIAELESRTEGWIAGLQLAAISMQRRKDRTGFIKSFTGGHRLVLDFLIEEVLRLQPKSTQNFLLQTAVLDRMTDSLCNVITGQENSQEILEMLDHANLFIVTLDDERRWFRYHHLFADLLRQRLRQTQPENVSTLHTRASKWYERNGLVDEAIEHALRAEDFERTAQLIEERGDAIWRRGEHAKLKRWLIDLPDELVFSRPQLCIYRAWYLFASGQQHEAEVFLETAELADDSTTTPFTEADPKKGAEGSGTNRLMLRGRVAAIRAFMAGFLGDAPAIIQYSKRALDDLPEEDLTWRSTAAVALGDGYGMEGDMNLAYRARLDASEVCKEAGNIYFLMVANSKLAMTLREQGRLEETVKLCELQIQIAKENGLSKSGVAGGLLAIWGEVLAELNDLDGAIHLAKNGAEMTLPSGPLAALGWSHLCLLRILFSCGDLQGMEDLIQKVEEINRKSEIPPWISKQVTIWQTRLWLVKNKLQAASQQAEASGIISAGISPDQLPETNFFTLIEYIVLARTLIAQERLDDAIRLLQWLFEQAEIRGRTSKEIEILLLQALAFQARGDTNQAVDNLERALTLAEPEGFVRIFVDEGPPMARLLYETLRREVALDYVSRLLQAFPIDESEHIGLPDTQSSESGYIEPLSEREIEVLQLIAKGLTNPEIATRLILSLYTVKTHARNIYSKLGVNNRIQAVDKAKTLGILPSN